MRARRIRPWFGAAADMAVQPIPHPRRVPVPSIYGTLHSLNNVFNPALIESPA